MRPIISLSDNAFSTPGCQQTRDENFSVIFNPKAAISIVEKTRSLEGQSDTTFSTPYGCNETGNENLSVILNSKASSFVPGKAWSLEGLNQRSEPYYPKTSSETDECLSESVDTSEGSDSSDSTVCLPLLDETPLVLDDITTPNLSLVKVNDTPAQEIKSTDTNAFPGELNEIKGILLNAGYTLFEVRDILSSYLHGMQGERNRPSTHIFYQGKAYTYGKLEIESPLRKMIKPVISSTTVGIKPDAKCSASDLDPKAIPFNSEKLLKKIPETMVLDAFTILKNIRMENLKNIIIGQLNINSLRNKIQDLAELMKGNLDIVVLTETKLDSTFPEKQFLIPGYKKPFRADRNRNGGGVMIYVREDIPCDVLLKHSLPENIEAILIEINLRKNKLLLPGMYPFKKSAIWCYR